MNHHPPISDAGNVVTLRAFLQQAVDHYPRLVAFSFTVLLPHSATRADSRALIMRFHTEVWRCIGKYSWQRQQAHHHSPPTILRWLWEAGCVPESRMIMLMNLDTLDVLREGRLPDSSRLEINAIISDAWRAVAGVDEHVMNMKPFFISRSGKDTFTAPFNQLQASVQKMVLPVMMDKTGVICP